MSHHYPYMKPVNPDLFYGEILEDFLRGKFMCIDKEAFKIHPTGALKSSVREGFEVFGHENFRGSDKDQLIGYLQYSHQCAISYFRLADNIDQPMQFTIEGNTYETVGQKCKSYFDFDSWLNHLSVAILLRDQAAVKCLCVISPEAFNDVEMKSSEFDKSVMVCVQGILTQQQNLDQLIKDVMVKTEPEYSESPLRHTYDMNVVFPFVNLVVLVISNADETQYQNAVIKALDRHKRDWTSDDQTKASPRGWVAYLIAAAASLAYDHKGFKLPELTDGDEIYLPEWLIYGDFEPQPSVGEDFFEGEI